MVTSCIDTVSPESEWKRFCIYLLQDEQLSTKDVEQAPIYSLKLKEKPLITYSDILNYDFETHIIYLKKTFKEYFHSDSVQVFSKLFGRPFVIMAKGERIYLGSLHTLLSSWLPMTPLIYDLSVKNSTNSFQISIAPHDDKKSFIDVRNDQRIITALKDK
jgi:hypothetical protein